MEKKYSEAIPQGDGSIAFICEEWDGVELINKYMVSSIPLNWAGLRLGLMNSQAFIRILSNQTDVNMVAYGALQTILSTESNEQHLLQMLQLTMGFTDSEKIEINKILSDNYFTVQL